MVSIGAEKIKDLQSINLWTWMIPYGFLYCFAVQKLMITALLLANPLSVSVGSNALFFMILTWSAVLLNSYPSVPEWFGIALIGVSILSSTYEIISRTSKPVGEMDDGDNILSHSTEQHTKMLGPSSRSSSTDDNRPLLINRAYSRDRAYHTHDGVTTNRLMSRLMSAERGVNFVDLDARLEDSVLRAGQLYEHLVSDNISTTSGETEESFTINHPSLTLTPTS